MAKCFSSGAATGASACFCHTESERKHLSLRLIPLGALIPDDHYVGALEPILRKSPINLTVFSAF